MASRILGMSTLDEVVDQRVQVYSRHGCKYCTLVKETLKDFDIKFVDINVFEVKVLFEDRTAQRIAFTKTTTVPQIFIGETHIGGYDQLIALVNSQELWPLLKKYNITFSLTPTLNEANPTVVSNVLVLPSTTSEPMNSLAIRDKILDFIQSNSLFDANPSKNIDELSHRLYIRSAILLDRYTAASRKLVDYPSLFRSPEFLKYVLISTELSLIPEEQLINLSDGEKICFFSNLYNAMVIHGKCVYPPQSIHPTDLTDTFNFFTGITGVTYNISGCIFSLDDIEHGVLRANRPHPKFRHSQSTYFQPEDRRTLFAINQDSFDPRIHFILNCGAKSCPPISLLTKDNLEDSLLLATVNYLKSEVHVIDLRSEEKRSYVRLPKLLLWYGYDFGGESLPLLIERVLNYFEAYREKVQSSDITELCSKLSLFLSLSKTEKVSVNLEGNSSPGIGRFEVVYDLYDWSLNQQ
eukprot:gene12024-13134_t